MLKARKLLSLLIALAVALSLFSGCKKEPGDPKDSGGKSSAPKTSSQKKTTGSKSTSKSSTKSTTGSNQDQDDQDNNDGNDDIGGDNGSDSDLDPDDIGVQDDEIIDLGGRTITWMTWTRVRGREQDEAFFKAVELIEQKYNCNFEIGAEGVTWSVSIPQWIQDYMAGIATYDLVGMYGRFAFPTLADTGAFHALDEYIADLPDELRAKVDGEDTIWRGNKYALSENYSKSSCLVYNSNILANEGIPDINDFYVANDQWTWNEFLDIGLKTTKDLNGDGIVDQWGLGSSPTNLGISLVASNGGEYIKFNGTEYVWNMQDHKVLNALQFMSDLYNTYKISKVWGGNWGHNTDWINGKIAMSMGEFGIIKAHVMPVRPDASEYVHTYVPKSPNNLDADYHVRYVLDPYFLVIPSYVENPGDVVRIWADLKYIMEANVSEEEREAAIWASLDTQFTNDRDKQFRRQMMREMEEGRFPIKFQPIGSFGDLNNDIINKVFNQIISLKTTVSAAVDAITPQYVQLLKDYQAID